MRHLPSNDTVTRQKRVGQKTLLACSLGLLAACSGSGGGSGGPAGSVQQFGVTGISVPNNSILPLNRNIQISFSSAVDFATVSNSSIQITTDLGVRATGSFTTLMLDTDADGIVDTPDLSVVVWQAACPIMADLSDAGLLPATTYTLRIRGADSAAAQFLRGADGRDLENSETRLFSTPNSSDIDVLFDDPVAGSPVPVLRALGSTIQDLVCAVELGGNADPNARLYFERDDMGSQSVVVPGPAAASALVPLNLYSDATTAVAFLVALDQPLNPSESNLSSGNIQLEYQVPAIAAPWVPIETRLELISNCISMGTILRLEPSGILPAGSHVRVVLRAGLQGLGGVFDATGADQTLFAVVQTQDLDHSTLPNPQTGADELYVEFDVGGAGPDSFEGDGSQSVVPVADWGQGRLASSLNFDGTGGINGDFDWIVKNSPEAFDTSEQVIVGGPNGSRSLQMFVEGGVVDVHDFIILSTAILRVSGPNAFVVNATGEIRIEGGLEISGFGAKDVATLNTGNQPEKGGAGVCGGGDGGGTSSVLGASTPRGDSGQSPFGGGLGGGMGGEAGFIFEGGTLTQPRAGGGGGGRFALDQSDVGATGVPGPLPSNGMFAFKGASGQDRTEGGLSGIQPVPGGDSVEGPFVDGNSMNNFVGLRSDVQVAILADGTAPVILSVGDIITGELSGISAGYGGGGGGDFVRGPGFPTPNWNPSADFKGGGGGAGGGAIRLRALGPIRFVGLNSELNCNGGLGGFGETKAGGLGGSGSGGHVILESATNISFELPPVSERPPGMRRHIFIDARGVIGRSSGGFGAGGPGGPGVIQLHVPDAISPAHEDSLKSDLILPVGTIADLDAGDPNALFEVMRPAGVQLLSNFGALSAGQSRWIDLRSAGVRPDGGRNLLRFLFKGVDPATGSVQTTNGQVQTQASILSGSVDGLEVAFSGIDSLVLSSTALQPWFSSSSPVSEDLYLRTPSLLRNFILRMTPGIGTSLNFVVQEASYDPSNQSLSLQVAQTVGVDLGDLSGSPADPSFELIPRFFIISSGGVPNALADSADLRISFEGASAGPGGAPDESSLLVPATSDFADFDALAPGSLDFIRFNVLFNLDLNGVGVGLDTPLIELDVLRLPFLY